MTLKSKTAVITGSTSGIGLAVARALAKEGANVVINGFGKPEDIEKERAAIESEFAVTAHYSAADMTRPAEIAAMVGDAEKAFGSVDILVPEPVAGWPLRRLQRPLHGLGWQPRLERGLGARSRQSASSPAADPRPRAVGDRAALVRRRPVPLLPLRPIRLDPGLADAR